MPGWVPRRTPTHPPATSFRHCSRSGSSWKRARTPSRTWSSTMRIGCLLRIKNRVSRPEEAPTGRLLQKEQGFPMKWKRMVNYFRYPLLAAVAVFVLAAAEHRGVVKFGVVPVPGVTVTATQGDKKLVAVTGPDGAYAFPELADGVWNIQVEMLCFAPLKREIGISPGAPAAEWALQMLPMDQIKLETPAPVAPPTASTAPATTAAAAQPGAAPAAATTTAPAKGGKPAKNAKGAAATPAAGSRPGFQRAAVNATS